MVNNCFKIVFLLVAKNFNSILQGTVIYGYCYFPHPFLGYPNQNLSTSVPTAADKRPDKLVLVGMPTLPLLSFPCRWYRHIVVINTFNFEK